MTRWSKVRRGDRVELKGREYEVIKIKVKGSNVKVSVTDPRGQTFESKVPLDGKVKRLPLRDDEGRMTRWATKAEVTKPDRAVPAGDATAKTPPRKPGTDPWETRRDKVERRLEEVLGAHMVGQATDESVGYYVPPVDVSTVAAHWMIFHHGDAWVETSPTELLGMHSVEHLAIEAGGDAGKSLKVNHWHTETRPS